MITYEEKFSLSFPTIDVLLDGDLQGYIYFSQSSFGCSYNYCEINGERDKYKEGRLEDLKQILEN